LEPLTSTKLGLQPEMPPRPGMGAVDGKGGAAARVAALRERMKDLGVDAWLVPSEDAHQSEYVAACDRRRAFLTGFTGSAGVAVVTMNEARCWTDGRYFLQAEQELDPTVWKMMKMYEDLSLEGWISTHLGPGAVLGVHDMTISAAMYERLSKEIQKNVTESDAVTVSALSQNLVDDVWGANRPPLPRSTVFVHEVEFAGKTCKEKIQKIRRIMSGQVKDSETVAPADFLVVTALDEVAWLLNLRGFDVEYNPVFWAYIVVTMDDVLFYVDSSRFHPGVADHLASSNVNVRPYTSIADDLRNLCRAKVAWIHPNTCNMALVNSLERAPAKRIVKRKVSPVALQKALKNKTELQGMRNCHLRDGIAVVRYFAWLESELKRGHALPTECKGADVLESLRRVQDHYVSLSFPTISSTGANAAIIHYQPEPETCARLSKEEIYLCDSGGQYRDGTTDVTRTIHLGEPSRREVECYTRVLKGHIAIDSCVFPEGTTGHILDVLARCVCCPLLRRPPYPYLCPR